LVEEEVEILTQRSSSSSQESQAAGSLNMKAVYAKKPFKKRQPSMKEEVVDTQDLPGSNFMISRREEFYEFYEDAVNKDDELEP
jgi:hypothetical protein